MRSRRAMQIVVGVVVLGLVMSMGYGFITSRHAPEPPPTGAQEPDPAPDMDSLGSSPNRVEYSDLGEYCEATECARVVSVSSEDLSAEEAIEAIYTTLLDRGMGRMLPPGEEDPEEVDWADSALTDNTVVIHGSDQPASPEAEADGAIAHLLITHAAEPQS